LKKADRDALAVLAKVAGRRKDLVGAFAIVRRYEDGELLAALDGLAAKRAVRRSEGLEAEVRARLAPLLASAQDKADALADFMAREAGGQPLQVRGFAAMVRALARRCNEPAVLAAADALMAEIAAAAGRDRPP
jgi:pyruvate-formate lyase-activating enzyme